MKVMLKKQHYKHKGYALLIAILLVSLLSAISLTLSTSRYKFNARIEKNIVTLQEKVK